jgi:hypothetical protein
MTKPSKPVRRRREKAILIIGTIILLVMIVVFVGRALWHNEELQEDQATGANSATEHTQPLNQD